MKIGYGLTACVADIALGKVRIDEVLHVMTGQRYSDLAHMLQILAEWRVGRVDRHLEIARTLWETGRIYMPSRNAARMPTNSIWISVSDAVAVPLKAVSQPSPLADEVVDMTLTAGQHEACAAMDEGRTIVVVGAPCTGRSTLAARAATGQRSGRGPTSTLVMCRSGRDALAMRNRGVVNVITYAEIDELGAVEAAVTLGGYDRVIMDDYDPAWAQVADMHLSDVARDRRRPMSIMRVGDAGTPLAISADVVLEQRLRTI